MTSTDRLALRCVMKMLVVLVVVLLAGCGYRPLEELAISPEFSDEEIEVISASAEEWFALVPETRVRVFVGDQDGNSIQKARRGDKQCKKYQGYTVLSPVAKARIYLCNEPHEWNGPAHWRGTVMHEIAHGLAGRVDHVDDKNSLMSKPRTKNNITGFDVEFVRTR